MRVFLLTPFASFYVEIVQDQYNRVNTFFTFNVNFLINSLISLHFTTNSLEYHQVFIYYKETAMHSCYAIIEASLQKKRVSRVPCFPLIDIAFAAAYLGKPMREVQLNPGAHAEALSRCAGDLPVDGVYINLGLASGQAFKLSEDSYRIDDALTLVIPNNDVLSISHTDIESLDDERICAAELFHPGILETYQAMDDEIKKNSAVAVGVTGTFSQVAFLYGIPKLMMSLLDQPQQVHRALDLRHEVVLRQVRELCGSGARFVWIGEGLGSGSLISPEQYREYALPYEQSLAEEIRKAGALSILHICGDVTSALPDIARCKADGFDLDYPVDLATAVGVLLPEITIKGNIDPTLFLGGRQDALRKSCRHALMVAGQTDGFILSTGCLVPRDATVESFEIVSEICAQHKLA